MPETNPESNATHDAKDHFLQVVSKVLNRQIRDFIDPENKYLDTDITHPIGALKQACLLRPEDGLILNIAKMIFFGLFTGAITHELSKEFYGVPKSDFKQHRNNINTSIHFQFVEPIKLQRERKAKHPKRMQFTISLMKDATAITEQELTTLTQKINQYFPKITHRNQLHYCGLERYSYYDPSNGVQLKGIQSANQVKAITFITAVLSIFNLTFDPTRMNLVSKVQKIDENETTTILGKPVKTNRGMVTAFVALSDAVFIAGNNDADRVLVSRPFVEIK